MELYVINPEFTNRENLIERYESFIWTERYSDLGDLTLETEPSQALVSLLTPGTFIGFDESNRIMEIKSALRAKNAEGKNVLSIKGKTIEDVLNYRCGAPFMPMPPNWIVWDTIGHFITELVRRTCTTNSYQYDANNAIPYLVVSDLSGLVVPQTCIAKCDAILFKVVKEVCDSFGLGFRIVATLGSPAVLTFEVYTGVDRSGANGITFSENLDNLSQTSYLASNDDMYNSAYIYSVNDWAFTGNPTAVGLHRKMLIIDATSIEDEYSPELTALLIQRATEELTRHRQAKLFDGVVNANGIYKINRDYFLGDLVSLVGEVGQLQTAIVTEHIWSSDANGRSSYPTLSII